MAQAICEATDWKPTERQHEMLQRYLQERVIQEIDAAYRRGLDAGRAAEHGKRRGWVPK